MPERDTTSVPPAFHSSLPLTVAERDIEAWYFPFPTAHIPAPRPEPRLYIGSTDRPEVSQ